MLSLSCLKSLPRSSLLTSSPIIQYGIQGSLQSGFHLSFLSPLGHSLPYTQPYTCQSILPCPLALLPHAFVPAVSSIWNAFSPWRIILILQVFNLTKQNALICNVSFYSSFFFLPPPPLFTGLSPWAAFKIHQSQGCSSYLALFSSSWAHWLSCSWCSVNIC